MSLQSLLPSQKSRPSPQFARGSNLLNLAELIHTNFSLTTWLLFGACLQSTLALVVANKYYAFLPAILILTTRIINAFLIHYNIKPNPYLEAVLPGKSTAIIPNAEGNLKPMGDGQEKVAVCLLGAKCNHPFGFFAPEFMKTFKWLAEMNASFDSPDGAPGGFLGQTSWQRKDERGGMEFMFLSYWRSIEDLVGYFFLLRFSFPLARASRGVYECCLYSRCFSPIPFPYEEPPAAIPTPPLLLHKP